MIDRVPLSVQPGRHAPDPVEGRLCVLLVQQQHQRQVFCAFFPLLPNRLVVYIGAMQPQQLALPSERDLRVIPFYQFSLPFN